MGWVVSVTLRPRFSPGERTPVPIVQEAGWTLEPVWIQKLEEKSFRLCRGSNLDRSVIQPIARDYTDWATPPHSLLTSHQIFPLANQTDSRVLFQVYAMSRAPRRDFKVWESCMYLFNYMTFRILCISQPVSAPDLQFDSSFRNSPHESLTFYFRRVFSSSLICKSRDTAQFRCIVLQHVVRWWNFMILLWRKNIRKRK
jgi:hypothetical protein